MSPFPGEPLRHGNPQPSLPAGEKHTRDDEPQDRGLSLESLLALHASADLAGVWGVALTALTDPARGGFPAAFLFLLDEERAELRGYRYGPEAGDGSAARQAFPSLRIALDVGAEYPLVKALRARAPLEIPSAEEPVLRDFLAAVPGAPGRVTLHGLRGQERAVGVLALAGPPVGSPVASGIDPWIGHLGLALERRLFATGHAFLHRSLAALEDGVHALLIGTNLADALLTAAQTAARLAGGQRALAWTYTEASRELTLAAQYVIGAEGSEVLDAALPRFHDLATGCAHQGGALLYPDLREVAALGLEALPAPLPAVVIPLQAFGEVLGVLAVIDRTPASDGAREPFTQADEDALRVIGGVAALTIKTTRLQEAVRDSERQVREGQRALVDTERLAALGELSAKLIEELRSPVSAISGIARRVERRIQKGDPNRDEISALCREATRLDDLLSQQAQVAKPGKPRLVLRQLTQVVHGAVALVREELMGRGIFLEETYADQMPDLLLDAERIQHVVLNILRSALEAVHDGDTLRIETLREGDRALLEIAHTGKQTPGEILEKLFVPFATSGPAGAGLGLAVAHQVIKEHGGEISVRSEGEWGAIYTISLPIRANQERRRMPDRRAGRERRRPGRRDEAA